MAATAPSTFSQQPRLSENSASCRWAGAFFASGAPASSSSPSIARSSLNSWWVSWFPASVAAEPCVGAAACVAAGCSEPSPSQ